jgi:hypothetical protein
MAVDTEEPPENVGDGQFVPELKRSGGTLLDALGCYFAESLRDGSTERSGHPHIEAAPDER